MRLSRLGCRWPAARALQRACRRCRRGGRTEAPCRVRRRSERVITMTMTDVRSSAIQALRHARAGVRPASTVLVVDERAAETFTAPGDEIERFFAASAIWCLPQGRV